MSCFQESGKYSLRMPNKWNFSFDYFYAAILVLAIYAPGSSCSSSCLAAVFLFASFGNCTNIVCCRKSSYVYLHACSEVKSSLKIQKRVERMKANVIPFTLSQFSVHFEYLSLIFTLDMHNLVKDVCSTVLFHTFYFLNQLHYLLIFFFLFVLPYHFMRNLVQQSIGCGIVSLVNQCYHVLTR